MWSLLLKASTICNSSTKTWNPDSTCQRIKSIGSQFHMLAFILTNIPGFRGLPDGMAWRELGLGMGLEKGTQIWRLGFMKPLSRASDSSRVCGKLAMQKYRLSLLNHRLTPHCFTRLSLIYQRSELDERRWLILSLSFPQYTVLHSSFRHSNACHNNQLEDSVSQAPTSNT